MTTQEPNQPLGWGAANRPPQARRASESLSYINFYADEANIVYGQFLHRDGRLWMARIVPYVQHPVLTLTSPGCREYEFNCESIASAKGVTMVFANLPLPVYSTLTADANGTIDRPVAGDLCALQVQVCKAPHTASGAAHPQWLTIHGMGRINNGVITLFPSPDVIYQILVSCCDNEHADTPVVPANINGLPSQQLLGDAAIERFNSRLRTGYVDQAEAKAAAVDYLTSMRDYTAAAAINPPPDRERMIQLREPSTKPAANG